MLEFSYRLEDILHEEGNLEGARSTSPRLYLVFEFMHMDLKKYIDTVQGDLDLVLVKVCSLCLIKSFRILDIPALGSGVSGTRLSCPHSMPFVRLITSPGRLGLPDFLAYVEKHWKAWVQG